MFLLSLVLASLSVYAQEETVRAFPAAFGQAGNVAYTFGQPFYRQISNAEGWNVAAGVQQAQLNVEEYLTESCQNDVVPAYPFYFSSVDEEGNLIPAGSYDTVIYDVDGYNYDLKTKYTFKILPVYEVYDTIRLNYDELAESEFPEPGRYDQLLATEYSGCDSLVHYMVYVCGFPEEQVLDGDENTYNSVWVGHHCWTGRNMRTTTTTTGAPVQNMVYRSDMFPDENANLNTYGRLYTWTAALCEPVEYHEELGERFVQGICPDGWHIPTAENMSVLYRYPTSWLKSDSLWLIPGDNRMLFDARPAGMYNPNTNRFENLLGYTHYWSDVEVTTATALETALSSGCDDVLLENVLKRYGMSVRCVLDDVYPDSEWTEELRKTPKPEPVTPM